MTDHMLLIVGGRIQTQRKAVELGVRFVLIQHKEHFVPESVELAEAVLIADYTDWDTVRPLVEAAHKVYGFTRVVSITEPGLVPAARISDLLNLGGTSERTAELIRDKLAMRRHLAAHGSPEAVAASVAAAEINGPNDLWSFGEAHGYPFVLKPADATASLGIVRVDSPEQAEDAWAEAEALRARTDLQWGSFFTIDRFLAEEFIEGPEYSVEAFSFAGRHVVLAITEKLTGTDAFVELGHALPARLDPAVEQEVVDCVGSFLDAVELKDGATHTELRITPKGPKIIESHNRMGGDRIFDLLDAAYGINLEQWTVAWQFRLIEPLTERPIPRCSAATRFLSAEPGLVTDVRGVDEALAEAGTLDVELTVRPGRTVPPLQGNWDRVGQVLATAATTEAAVATAERLSRSVTVVISPQTADSSDTDTVTETETSA
jgi:biotin carboxylase